MHEATALIRAVVEGCVDARKTCRRVATLLRYPLPLFLALKPVGCATERLLIVLNVSIFGTELPIRDVRASVAIRDKTVSKCSL
jgi:hypothetical protein